MEAGKQKIVWSGWYKQPATKIVIGIQMLTYVFNLCIEKNVFPSELKKAKVVPLPKSTDKKIQPITDQHHFCLFCQSFSKSMCTFT